MTTRRRKRPAKKATVTMQQVDQLATALTSAVNGLLRAEAEETDTARQSLWQRENARALQQYLAEYVTQAKRVDALISALGDEIGKGQNLEHLCLYTAAQRLGIVQLPAPRLTVTAIGGIAEAVRVLRSGGTPLPVSLTQGAAERLQLIIEGNPLYQPGPDL